MFEETTKTMPEADVLLKRASDLLLQALRTTIVHFENNKIKSSCGVTIEFFLNKDEDVVMKFTPNTKLPLNSEEMIGELTDNGLHIIEN